jgi:hypothetical protein
MTHVNCYNRRCSKHSDESVDIAPPCYNEASCDLDDQDKPITINPTLYHYSALHGVDSVLTHADGTVLTEDKIIDHESYARVKQAIVDFLNSRRSEHAIKLTTQNVTIMSMTALT